MCCSLLISVPKYCSVRGFRVLSKGPIYLRVDTYGVNMTSASWGLSSGGTQNMDPLATQ